MDFHDPPHAHGEAQRAATRPDTVFVGRDSGSARFTELQQQPDFGTRDDLVSIPQSVEASVVFLVSINGSLIYAPVTTVRELDMEMHWTGG